MLSSRRFWLSAAAVITLLALVFAWTVTKNSPTPLPVTAKHRDHPQCRAHSEEPLHFQARFHQQVQEGRQHIASHSRTYHVRASIQAQGSIHLLVDSPSRHVGAINGVIDRYCRIRQWQANLDPPHLAFGWALRFGLHVAPAPADSRRDLWRRLEPALHGRYLVQYQRSQPGQLTKVKKGFFPDPSHGSSFRGTIIASQATVTFGRRFSAWVDQVRDTETLELTGPQGINIRHSHRLDLRQVEPTHYRRLVAARALPSAGPGVGGQQGPSTAQQPAAADQPDDEDLRAKLSKGFKLGSWQGGALVLQALQADPDLLEDTLLSTTLSPLAAASVAWALAQPTCLPCSELAVQALSERFGEGLQEAVALAVAAQPKVDEPRQRAMVALCEQAMADDSWRPSLSPACLAPGRWAIGQALAPSLKERASRSLQRVLSQSADSGKLTIALAGGGMMRDPELGELVRSHLNHPNSTVRREAILSAARWVDSSEAFAAVTTDSDPQVRAYVYERFGQEAVDPKILNGPMLDAAWEQADSSQERRALVRWLGRHLSAPGLRRRAKRYAANERDPLVQREFGRFFKASEW